MPYLLALIAVALPTYLVVQVLRGRARASCCAPPADQDARLREAPPAETT